MLIIGLTGGIGSGKSTVTGLFSALGVPCCDADDISHQLTRANSPVLAEICALFGLGILNNEGQLDRRQLRNIIFSNDKKRHQLEAILHPRIAEAIQHWIAQQTADYVIVSIPLLVESQSRYNFDRVLVIELDPAIQLERTARRDKVTEADIQAIVATQASDEQRRAIADDIINNTGDIEELRRQVSCLHEKYLNLV